MPQPSLTAILTSLNHQVLSLRTALRAAPLVIHVDEVLQLEQLTRAVELLRQDLIVSDAACGIDNETIGVKHGLTAGRIAQIKTASTRLPKGGLIKPSPRRPYSYYKGQGLPPR